MIGYETEQTKNLLIDLELNVDEDGFVRDQDGEIKICPTCKTKISKAHVGCIAYGSTHVFCDNPLCFLTHLETKEKNESD